MGNTLCLNHIHINAQVCMILVAIRNVWCHTVNMRFALALCLHAIQYRWLFTLFKRAFIVEIDAWIMYTPLSQYRNLVLLSHKARWGEQWTHVSRHPIGPTILSWPPTHFRNGLMFKRNIDTLSIITTTWTFQIQYRQISFTYERNYLTLTAQFWWVMINMLYKHMYCCVNKQYYYE